MRQRVKHRVKQEGDGCTSIQLQGTHSSRPLTEDPMRPFCGQMDAGGQCSYPDILAQLLLMPVASNHVFEMSHPIACQDL